MNKPKFNIDDYPGKYVMHCNSEGKAMVFCRYMDSIGLKWSSGRSYFDYNFWTIEKEETCYSFNDGEYSSAICYFEILYTILEFDDFDWSEK